jgi:FtsZ-binding cell division protein ZapB
MTEDPQSGWLSRFTVAERLLGLITALLVLSTSYLTYLQATLPREQIETQTEIESLRRDNARLKAENDSLQKQLKSRASTGDGPASPNGGSSSNNPYRIRLDSGWSADLDTRRKVRSVNNSAPVGADVRHSEDPAFGFNGESGYLFPTTAAPSQGACEAAMQQSEAAVEYTPVANLPKGTRLCIQTDQKKVAMLEVEEACDLAQTCKSTTYYLVFKVYLWSPG